MRIRQFGLTALNGMGTDLGSGYFCLLNSAYRHSWPRAEKVASGGACTALTESIIGFGACVEDICIGYDSSNF